MVPRDPAAPELLRAGRVCRAFVTPAETVHAVREVSLRARAGEFVCLYGPSGSGKTTLLSLIAGLDVPDSGHIHVAGIDVGTLDEGKRARLRLETVGVVFQEHHLIDEFTVWENVALPLEVRGASPARPGPPPWPSWRGSGWAVWQAGCPASCPAVSGNASASRGPSSGNAGYCWPTSQRARSTR